MYKPFLHFIRYGLLLLAFHVVAAPSLWAQTGGDLECPAGQVNEAGLCYAQCEAGYETIGLLCSKKCPDGFTNDGASCRKDAHIFAKESYPRGAGTPLTCGPGQEQGGALCYPACADGYYGVGPVCWQSCASGYTDHGASCYRNLFDWYFKRTYGRGAGSPLNSCPAGTQKDGALCYPVCREGFGGAGPACWRYCPSGYADDGAVCRKDVQIIFRETYGRGAGTIPLSLSGTCRISYPTQFADGAPRRLNQVAFLTAHNAFANTDDTWVHAMQTFNIKKQLEGGVRGLMLDIYVYEGEVKLCHGGCTGAAGSNFVTPRVNLADGLKPVKEFLDGHPREIVTIVLESGVNDASKVRNEFVKAGLAAYIYDPEDDPEWKVSQKGRWPTINWLIARNRRLFVTSQRYADSSSEVGPVPQFNHTVENTYDLGATGASLECANRGESSPLGDLTKKLFVFNHFRSLPSLIAAGIDNTQSNITDRVKNRCLAVASRPPNLVAVDYYQQPYCGAAKAVVDINAMWENYRSDFGHPFGKEFTLYDQSFFAIYSPGTIAALGSDAGEEARFSWHGSAKSTGEAGSTLFDAAYYLTRYSDLSAAFGSTNYAAALNHWIEYGIAEGRQGSPLFDVRFYLRQYADLRQAFGEDYLAAMKHWQTFGLTEGRRGSQQFDVNYYYSLYPDLQRAFGKDHLQLMVHYLRYGRNEGRSAAP